MRILLLGADGQLGHELRGALGCFADLAAASRREGDLEDGAGLAELVRSVAPALIVNAAAYTDVDGAEREPARAHRINAEAVAELGQICLERSIGLVHVSTDFVFDGDSTLPYAEDDPPAPLGVYGQSKLAGERALAALEAPAIVLRTAWVYSLRRKSFVSTMLRLGREREELRVVADQVGNPTFCRDLAQAIALLSFAVRADPAGALGEARGVYHLAGTGMCSRYELAVEALARDPRRAEQRVRRIVPIASADYPLPARRPLRSALACDKIAARFGLRLPHWREALARALGEG